MPRKPLVLRPSRQIRTALGLTQERMAQLLGVSRVTVEKLENGRLKMPKNMAYKYQALSGCDLREGDREAGEGELELVPTVAGKPVSKEAVRQHWQKVEDEGLVLLQQQAAAAPGCLELLIKAAERDGKGPQLVNDFEEFARRTFHNYSLAGVLQEMLEEDYQPRPGNEVVSLDTAIKSFGVVPLLMTEAILKRLEPTRGPEETSDAEDPVQTPS